LEIQRPLTFDKLCEFASQDTAAFSKWLRCGALDLVALWLLKLQG
jgi:hypothetical protein